MVRNNLKGYSFDQFFVSFKSQYVEPHGKTCSSTSKRSGSTKGRRGGEGLRRFWKITWFSERKEAGSVVEHKKWLPINCLKPSYSSPLSPPFIPGGKQEMVPNLQSLLSIGFFYSCIRINNLSSRKLKMSFH